MTYLICFAVSAWFAYLAKNAKNRGTFLILSFLSIMTTVMLAGLRDYSIGIDVKNYLSLKEYWAGAISSNSVLEYLQTRNFEEPLFCLFLGSIAKLIGEYRVFLFLSHFVIVTGVYIGAFRQRKYIEPSLVLILFYLLYFDYSLNIIRQYMAMAIVFAAFADIQQRKYIRYSVVVLIASMIHLTALLGMGYLFLHLFLYWKQGVEAAPKWRIAFVCIGLFAVVVCFYPVCKFLINVGILPTRYNYFLKSDKAQATAVSMYYLILELAIFFFLGRNMKKKYVGSEFWVLCAVMYFIMMQLTRVLYSGRRIAFYFSFANMLPLALMVSSQKDLRNKQLLCAGVIVLCLLYWWFMFAYHNGNETFPYKLGVF